MQITRRGSWNDPPGWDLGIPRFQDSASFPPIPSHFFSTLKLFPIKMPEQEPLPCLPTIPALKKSHSPQSASSRIQNTDFFFFLKSILGKRNKRKSRSRGHKKQRGNQGKGGCGRNSWEGNEDEKSKRKINQPGTFRAKPKPRPVKSFC